MAQMLTQDADGNWVAVSALNPLPMSGGLFSEIADTDLINASTGSVTLKAANPERRGLIIFNDSDFDLYVSLDGAASSSNFSWLIDGHAGWVMPVAHRGIIRGAWESGVGSAKVTELY